MIHISDTIKRIQSFLDSKGEEQYKIFVRINFNIEVFVLTDNVALANNYQSEFIESFPHDGVDAKALKVCFKIVDADEAEGDPYYENIFRDEQKVDWGPRYRFDSLLNSKPSNHNPRKTPVVTFYSYKGGMGRTTSMVAYAMSLAACSDIAKRKRVVIIDCDLEAPGYLNFFNLSEHNGLRSGKKNGLVEFICDSQFTNKPEDIDITNYCINVGVDNKDSFASNNLESIWLVPAGNLNENYADDVEKIAKHESDHEIPVDDRNDYLEGLAKINLSSVSSVIKCFNLLFEKIDREIRPDIILIDSRTGFNDIFGTAALYLSDCVVGFFGFSRQTQPGLMNLVKQYYKPDSKFKLHLVFSIIPTGVSETWVEQHTLQVSSFINRNANETKDYPSFLFLHRDNLLETIGTGDKQSDEEFVELVVRNKNKDYECLFEAINDQFFKAEEEEQFTSKTPAIQLRNVVLKRLKLALANVSNFAEDTQISEKQFFYRECMKELFDSKKFLIQGYKGTGKTYLYKALSDKEISGNIQKWAGVSEDEMHDPIYVNILPKDSVPTVFDSIRYSGIEEPEYYFNAFWQIYTWNALLLRPEFEHIKNQSPLKEFVLELDGNGAKEALVRIDNLINKGLEVLITIEKDIVRLSQYLAEQNQTLFVLYDRLDTCINPLRWNKAVSPLINYWWSNCEAYSHIVPKIFIRTDLFRQIEGTNTARLANSIIHIEWSMGEVFGFFFKLIFSDETASKAYWAIAEKVGIDAQYIKVTKQAFAEPPVLNQFKQLDAASMKPIIDVFFGKFVMGGLGKLGTPWQYFEKELANADNTAISLRPFINTLNTNAVDQALAKTERYVKDGIISSSIYASKTVREQTTEMYFNDLIQDEFSKDLSHFREVIRTSVGEQYRFKALSEDQFEKLIAETFARIEDSSVVKNISDLKRLIFANGIMAEKITTHGRYYAFAPIYWYSWGLANSMLEKEEKRKSKQEREKGLEDGQQYVGRVVDVKNQYGRIVQRIRTDAYSRPLDLRNILNDEFYEDDIVTFVARKEPDKRNPNNSFWFADNVELKE